MLLETWLLLWKMVLAILERTLQYMDQAGRSVTSTSSKGGSYISPYSPFKRTAFFASRRQMDITISDLYVDPRRRQADAASTLQKLRGAHLALFRTIMLIRTHLLLVICMASRENPTLKSFARGQG